MSKDRMDRFVWHEGEIELYDKDGNRLDAKTMKPVANDIETATDENRKHIEKQ